MTIAQAFNSFWASFGMPAYEENCVPTGDEAPAFPYITYQYVFDGMGNQTVLSASVWTRTESPKQAEEKTEEIAKALANKKRYILPVNGGAVIFRPGTPFAQMMGDDSDNLVKRMVLNIEVQFANVF